MEESRLRLQIQLLRDELNKMRTLAQRCLGRQITPLDLSNSALIEQGHSNYHNSIEKLHFLDLAEKAMNELTILVNVNDPLWIEIVGEGGGVMESLNLGEYVKLFAPCLEIKPDNNSTHYATRASGIIAANSSTILRALMDENQWPYLCQTIIGTSALIDIIQEDNGTNLKMMYAELQALSSLIPVRKVKFIRFSRQVAEGVWGMVDVSVENSHDISETNPIINCRRFPSGCIVQDMPNGGSKVTWVEHLDFEENEFNHPLGVMCCSSSFGAQRWLGSLKRQCLCLAIITSPHDRISGMVNQSRKRSMANMAHRMVVQVGETMVTIRNNNPGEPTGVVLSASKSFCMPISHQSLFNFLSHKHTRDGELMEVHSTIPIMRELVRIDKNNGDHLNRVSFLVTKVLHGNNQNSVPILQETQSDGSGSLLVYAQVTLEGMQTVMEGRDSSLVEILPSGFSIIPNTKLLDCPTWVIAYIILFEASWLKQNFEYLDCLCPGEAFCTKCYTVGVAKLRVHVGPGSKFYFQNYIQTSLEDDFKTVVGSCLVSVICDLLAPEYECLSTLYKGAALLVEAAAWKYVLIKVFFVLEHNKYVQSGRQEFYLEKAVDKY
ncbi:homeobox-leucine zipper protein HDG1-like [Impatiens glandulifera]|uniref:homeobox-leucine zipper protein HDG1-like n=1 Tax=Impatiens glandulifera TaxID=253017 RepID=UPI001FB0D385|nr:homeobox-leucine zipper protein HDG1-like [Impatiens glandulifera]